MDSECGALSLEALLSPGRHISPKKSPGQPTNGAEGEADEPHRPLTETEVNTRSVKFRNVLRELADTERLYLKDIAGIIHGYQRQLQDYLTEDEVDLIFGNMEELHTFHVELSQRIDKCVKENPQMIGEVFVEMGLDRFMVYEQYYLDHTKSLSVLLHKQEDKTFLTMLVACQTNLGHQLPLADYLLKPVQRLLKYPLLLQELTKALPEESPGYPAILAAGKLLKDVADSINEIKRQLDVSRYVDGLQQRLLGWNGPNLQVFGQLKDAGDFKVSDATGKKSQRQVLLFESAILICKPRTGGFVSVKHFFNMDVLFLQTMLNEQLCFRLTVADNKKVYFTFYCQTQEEKQYWIAKIKKVIIEFHTNGRQAKSASTHDDKHGELGESGKRRGYHFRNRRKKISASHSASLGTIAPVSKKREDDVLLNHNPYAQAGGYDEAPEVKQVLRRDESSKRSRKDSRRRESHVDHADGSTTASSDVTGSVTTSDSGLRPNSALAHNRDSLISTGSEGAGGLHQMGQGESPTRPQRRNAAPWWTTRRRPSATSMADSSARSSPIEPYTMDDSLDVPLSCRLPISASGSPRQASSTQSSPGRGDVGTDHGSLEDEGMGPTSVVKCFFPDSSFTLVNLRSWDTIRTALRSRLARRGHEIDDCIVQVPGEVKSTVVGWDEPAIAALAGNTTILVTKIRASHPASPRKGTIIRLPSGHSLDIDSEGTGVLTPSPSKQSPLKHQSPPNPRLSFVFSKSLADAVRKDSLVGGRQDGHTDDTAGSGTPAGTMECVLERPESHASSVVDPVDAWTASARDTPSPYQTTSFSAPAVDVDNVADDEWEVEVPHPDVRTDMTVAATAENRVLIEELVAAQHASVYHQGDDECVVDERLVDKVTEALRMSVIDVEEAARRGGSPDSVVHAHDSHDETTDDEGDGVHLGVCRGAMRRHSEPASVLRRSVTEPAVPASHEAPCPIVPPPRQRIESNEVTVYAPTAGPQPRIPLYKEAAVAKKRQVFAKLYQDAQKMEDDKVNPTSEETLLSEPAGDGESNPALPSEVAGADKETSALTTDSTKPEAASENTDVSDTDQQPTQRRRSSSTDKTSRSTRTSAPAAKAKTRRGGAKGSGDKSRLGAERRTSASSLSKAPTKRHSHGGERRKSTTQSETGTSAALGRRRSTGPSGTNGKVAANPPSHASGGTKLKFSKSTPKTAPEVLLADVAQHTEV
eukprot:m.184402 g.184402  ORF g.184402 m.184402 type:complete len:1211 (-) comp16139_c0_seq1:207-3839(-)